MKRKAEMVLGLIGGILGICAGLFGVFVGEVANAMEIAEGSIVSGVAWFAILFSLLGIVGAALVTSKKVLGSVLLIVAAVFGFLCLTLFYAVPAVLMLIAGIMGLARKENASGNV